MMISFARSGGFAGKATNVSGVVRFDHGAGQVSAEGTDYRRDLTADEATRLQEMTAAMLAQDKPKSENSQMRDGFQYDVSVKTDDGKTTSRTLTSQGDPGTTISQTLYQWVQQETQKIWEHRLASIPK